MKLIKTFCLQLLDWVGVRLDFKNKPNPQLKLRFSKTARGFFFSSLVFFILAILIYPSATHVFRFKNKVFGEKIIAIQRQTGYPKLANYFLSSDQNFDYQKLASYDTVILPIDTQIYNPEFFVYARDYNPDIIILAYTPSQSVNVNALNDQNSFNYKLNAQIKDEWLLKDSNHNLISSWSGLKNINVNSDWNNWLPEFVQAEVLSNGFWDGIFYDMVDKTINWTNNGDIDLDNNGIKDEADYANKLWQNGFTKLLQKSRAIFGQEKIIVLNGAIDESWLQFANGIMFENFPTPWLGNSWQNSMNLLKKYQAMVPAGQKVFIINNLGLDSNFKKIRFDLISALFEDVYFSSDQSVEIHEDLRWYDEYDVNLGAALNKPYNLLNTNIVQYSASIWRRDFTNGITILNVTQKEQTINLTDGIYEKIRGQENQINNGQIVNQITLAPTEGVVLLRKLELLKNVAFNNGVFVRIFNNQSQVKRIGFYSYDPGVAGGREIILIDIDHDNELEKIIAHNGEIRVIKKSGLIMSSFYPYTKNYQKGAHLALADLNNDGQLEIVTGAYQGGGPHIRIFDLQGQLINVGWFAFDKNNRGGVSVALGDINNDGEQEIIAGAGKGLEPQVKIFSLTGKLLKTFLAYDKNFKGGVNVASADLNNDKINEIITGAGASGGPHVRIFNGQGVNLGMDFFAFDKNKRQGVRVGAGDIDDDGQIEILGMN